MQDSKRNSERPFGALSIAEGLLCPNCKRAIQIYDFESIDRSVFRINCGCCHRTVLAYEPAKSEA
jgi:hypothetical protein